MPAVVCGQFNVNTVLYVLKWTVLTVRVYIAVHSVTAYIVTGRGKGFVVQTVLLGCYTLYR